MTPAHAQRTAQNARRLLAAKIITPHDYAVLDAMLWRLRRPGRWDLCAAYRSIARLAGVCRDTAIEAVRKLEALGILTKRLDRVRVFWGRNRAQTASRQTANTYAFVVPSTESARPTPSKGLTRDSITLPGLEAVLDRLQVAIMGKPVANQKE